MAFVARLPTFSTPCMFYKFNPVTRTYAIQSAITGQIYTPQRNQDDQQGGLLYFMYPKEFDVIEDVYDHDWGGRGDVIRVESPAASGRYRAYNVREVKCRWLKFPNEHRIAELELISKSDWAKVQAETPLGSLIDDETDHAAIVSVGTYLLTDDAGIWEAGPTIDATVRFPDYGQPGTPFGTLYLLYSPDDNVLRDASELGQDPFYDTLAELDVVELSYPTASPAPHRFKVMQVFPRQLGSDDEHMVALVKQMTPTEVEAMTVFSEFNFTELSNVEPEFEATWTFPGADVDDAETIMEDDGLGGDETCFLSMEAPDGLLPVGVTIVGITKQLHYKDDSVVSPGNAEIFAARWKKISTAENADLVVSEAIPVDPGTSSWFGSPSSLPAGFTFDPATWNAGDIAFQVAAKQVVPDADQSIVNIKQDIGVRIYYTL